MRRRRFAQGGFHLDDAAGGGIGDAEFEGFGNSRIILLDDESDDLFALSLGGGL
jgi:hypothetical protein